MASLRKVAREAFSFFVPAASAAGCIHPAAEAAGTCPRLREALPRAVNLTGFACHKYVKWAKPNRLDTRGRASRKQGYTSGS